MGALGVRTLQHHADGTVGSYLRKRRTRDQAGSGSEQKSKQRTAHGVLEVVGANWGRIVVADCGVVKASRARANATGA